MEPGCAGWRPESGATGCRRSKVTSCKKRLPRAADFSPATDRMLTEVGYSVAFTSVHGAIRPGMKPISLPRVKIEGGEGIAMFRLCCRGAMDVWRAIDHASGRLRRARSETQAA